MIKAVIFDLDGTLADTMPDLQTAMNNMLCRLGYKPKTRTDLIKAINNGAKEFVCRSLPKDVQNVDFILQSAIDTYEDEYSVCYCDKTTAYPGIEALLMDLKAMGIKISVLSNKQDTFVKNIIGKLFDKKIFSCIQGQASMPTKPNPTSALAIAKSMGVKPSRCLFVGDSDVDIETATNAGMRSIGVVWGYREETLLLEKGATFIAKEPKDIIKIVTDLKNEKERRRKSRRAEAKALNKEKRTAGLEKLIE